MSETKAKRGRPPMPAARRKRNNIIFRARDSLKSQLEEVAGNNGRSLSEEVEFRLECSLMSPRERLILAWSQREPSTSLKITFPSGDVFHDGLRALADEIDSVLPEGDRQ